MIPSFQILGGTEEKYKRIRIEVSHCHLLFSLFYVCLCSLFYVSPELTPHR
jgi:hypothetical protein